MANLTIKAPGMLSSIQDDGRFGFEQVGVSVSGVMDSFAHRVANILLGNHENEAVMEVTMMGPTLEFAENTKIAITGADCSATLDGVPVKNWRSITINAGGVLKLAYAKNGVRAYIAIAGGFQLPVIMGSKSTYMRANIGGHEGRALITGDKLTYSAYSGGETDVMVASKCVPEYSSSVKLRVVLGPQDDYFTATGINTFFSSSYKVSSDFDRMGYRLEGDEIEHNDKGSDIISDGMLMGGVQVPGNGQPIILMADRQTTGGYTKIGCVISADLPKIAQAKAGDSFTFEQVTMEQAQDAFIKNEELIQGIKSSLVTVSDLESHGGTIFRMRINGKEYNASIYEVY